MIPGDTVYMYDDTDAVACLLCDSSPAPISRLAPSRSLPARVTPSWWIRITCITWPGRYADGFTLRYWNRMVLIGTPLLLFLLALSGGAVIVEE